MVDLPAGLRKMYRDNFLEHGDTPRGTFQNDRETMWLRYERLTRELPLADHVASIHDVGCGLCDLHRYLMERQIEHIYSGSELVSEMVDAARGRFSDVVIHNRDFLTAPTEPYDFVVASGVLNMRAGAGCDAWEGYVRDLIARMFACCRQAIAFNFLTSHCTFSREDLHYIDPAPMMETCLEMSRFVVIDHAYALYEATVTVFREEAIRERHRDAAFDRYFRK